MRLEKIKLAGFKSFVDPTSVPIPSNLVGIVGPNGCGKSNVIDAVSWVMGESSAKMLRGESMADVIFNGSSVRKPVGTASIELIFDNSEGRAGGQYAQYNTISVKRQVSRDGQSLYSLNSVRCRRRDITDLFLGTGLGPRSYSIIEQGMISRLIEARPDHDCQVLVVGSGAGGATTADELEISALRHRTERRRGRGRCGAPLHPRVPALDRDRRGQQPRHRGPPGAVTAVRRRRAEWHRGDRWCGDGLDGDHRPPEPAAVGSAG